MTEERESAVAGRVKWLNRSILGMGLTIFLSDAGHEMATAILPLFPVSSDAGHDRRRGRHRHLRE